MPIVNGTERTDPTGALGTPVRRTPKLQPAPNAAAAANYGSGGGKSVLFSEQYMADYIGLLSNPAFARLLGSLGPQDKSAALEMRRTWLQQQQAHYGENGDQRDDALSKLALWGGNSAASKKPSGSNMPVRVWYDDGQNPHYEYDTSGPDKFDNEAAYSFLRRLQSNISERNLTTYNEIVKVAAGVCGDLNGQGFMTAKIPGQAWNNPYNQNAKDPRMLYAVSVLNYNYSDDNSRGYNTWSQYQRNLLGTALDEINEGNFNGMFTDANSRFDDYQGVSLADLNVSAEQLGTMANRYNRYITELYLDMANRLARAGVTLPNNGRGMTAEALASAVQRVENARTWRKSGVSRLTSESLTGLKNSLKEWQTYKSAMDRLEAVSSQLRGLKWAQFTVAYCGGRDKEGTDKYWPWWEPNEQETKNLYWKAVDLLDRWDAMNDNYEKAVAAGDMTARRPQESDLEKEPEPYTESAVPDAGDDHPVTPMPSKPPVEGANGGGANFLR